MLKTPSTRTLIGEQLKIQSAPSFLRLKVHNDLKLALPISG